MPNPMVRSMYKSADMEKDLHVTWEPVHGIKHMRGHFGVVLHAQSKSTTRGVQKSIGPVNMKCPEARTLNFGSNIPCPLCDLAFARFSEDFLRLTHPTGGGPKVNWTC